MSSQGFRAVGTVRDNRTSKCPLVPVKEFAKKPRGDFEVQGDGQVVCIRWNDNSVVTIMSNCTTHLPLQSANRYSAKEKCKKSIQQPKLIADYNKGMGGVDLLDRLMGTYRPKLRSKKWWWNLFSNGLNMAVVAAWRLRCHLIGKDAISHLEFQREVAIVAMKVGLSTLHQRRGGPTAAVSADVRASSANHFLSNISQGRCSVCYKNTTKWCEFCEKRFHERCSTMFEKI